MSNTIVTSIIGGTKKGKFSSLQGSEYSINMYSEKNGDLTYLKSCPGIKWKLDLEDSTIGCKGSYVSSVGLNTNNNVPDAFFVINETIYRVDYNWNVSEIGSVAPGSRPIFCESGGERPMLLIADGSRLQYYNLREGGVCKEIRLPERVNEEGVTISPTYVQCIDGVVIVNDSGTGFIYYSIKYPLNSVNRDLYVMNGSDVVYEADGVTVKEESLPADQWVFYDRFRTPKFANGYSNSDSVEAIYAIGSNLMVFGPKSVEFREYTPNNESTDWNLMSSTFNREVGLDAPYSIASVNNNVCFLSNGMNAGRAIYMINGTQFTKISDSWLDTVLDYSDTSNAIGYSYSRSNHAFYCLYLPSCRDRFGNLTPKTYCYDIATSEWSERSSRDVSTNTNKPWNCIYPVWFNNETVFGHIKDGSIVYLDDDIHVEEINETTSIPLIRERQTSVIMNNYVPFQINELAVEANVGTILDYSANPSILLKVSKDGGNTFNLNRSAKLGKTGEYSYRTRFLNVGNNRLCVLRFSFSENMDLILTNISIRMTPLAYSV